MFAATLPLGQTQAANLMVSGIVATLLSFGALIDNRFRFGVSLLGGWVALSPFVFTTTMIGEVFAVSSGVAMFVFMMGPFSEPPRVYFTRPLAVRQVAPEDPRELARAA